MPEFATSPSTVITDFAHSKPISVSSLVTSKNWRRILLLKMALLALAVTLSVPATTLYSSGAQAKTCWPYGRITGREGRALKKSRAKKRARRKWRTKVIGTATAGWGYRHWGLAENRIYLWGCTKSGRWHKCKARATPCRP